MMYDTPEMLNPGPDLAASVLQGLGLKDYQVAAFLGQLQRESNFQPGINQIGGGGGRGWAQYTGPRRDQYEQFMAARQDPYTPQAEADYMKQELSSPAWAPYVQKIKSTPDLPAASAQILASYGLGKTKPSQAASASPRAWATLPSRIALSQNYLPQPSGSATDETPFSLEEVENDPFAPDIQQP